MIGGHHNLDAQHFAAAEKELGFSLPSDLREFYGRCNGGQPVNRLFVQGDEGFVVHYFKPLVEDSAGPPGSVVSSYNIWKSVGEFDALPIAYDEGGNLLLYSLDPKSRGEIFCTMPDCEPADRIHRLTNSLTEFLSGLQPWS
jgi:hypothetical protein